MKIKKLLFSSVLVFCVLFMSTNVNAQTKQYAKTVTYRSHSSHTVNSMNFTRVAYNGGRPLNQNIRLEVELAANYDVSIEMKDKYGNVVWSESKSFNTQRDGSRTFWCGGNVYSVEIKLHTEDPIEKIIRPRPVATCVTYYNV